ncbi:MAG: non-reducing end alpha-L-arabinofuranosidase family hydrolase [Thermoguttaceae bacterium]
MKLLPWVWMGWLTTVVLFLGLAAKVSAAAADKATGKAFEDGRFSWKASAPLVTASNEAADPAISIKDPTIIHDRDRWHLFATVRLVSGKVDIEYLNFADWKEANQASRHRLNLHDQYYCAPQVFYFRPQKLWYLIYQIGAITKPTWQIGWQVLGAVLPTIAASRLLPFPTWCKARNGRPTSATKSCSAPVWMRRWRLTRPMFGFYSRVPATWSTEAIPTVRFLGGWAFWR